LPDAAKGAPVPVELSAARDHGTEEHRHERARNALVGRIRGFFGLDRPND